MSAEVLRADDPRQVGEYRIVGRLAEGGQGVVYLGEDSSGGRVAVKLLRSSWLAEPAARARLGVEVAAARRVAPFCTARVIDARVDGDAPYIISEYVEGVSLAAHVAARGPIAGSMLDRLAIGTTTALVAIHQASVVHRDFKPGNVLLGPDGPRVIDFGIARDLNVNATMTGHIFGTPAYMAPEQFLGMSVGPASDMFAWASTMIFAATGRAPFPGTTVGSLAQQVTNQEPDLSGVPDQLARILRECLLKDAAARPTAAQTLLLLLGQPMPNREFAVRSDVLAEATRLTLVAPASGVPAPAGPPVQAGPPAPAQAGHGVRFAPGQATPGQAIPGQVPVAHAVPAPTLPAYAAPGQTLPGHGLPRHQQPGHPQTGHPQPSHTLPGYQPHLVPAVQAPAPTHRGWLRPVLIFTVLAVVLSVAAIIIGSNLGNVDDSGTVSRTTQPAPALTADGRADPTRQATTPAAETTTRTATGNDSGLTSGIPAAFLGTWSGMATQVGGTVPDWNLTIKFENTVAGTMVSSDLGCGSLLTVTAPYPTSTVLHLHQATVADTKKICAKAAEVTLTLATPTTMEFSWRDAAAASNTATATLTKQ